MKYYKFPNPTAEVGILIKRRRLQMLIHSCIYYELDDNIIGDHLFDKWAIELAQLLKDHPDAYSDRFDSYFEGWNGSSGYNLPHRDPWVLEKANTVLRNSKS